MESTLALLEEQQLELLRLARSRGDLTDFRTREDSLEGGEEDCLEGGRGEIFRLAW